MKEASEEELPNEFTDGLRQTIHICVQNTTLVNQLGIYNIWMQTTYMGGQCLNPFPTGGFCWAEVHPDEISELVNRSDCGYLLEVDVAYPRELHDFHNDLPFMCRRMTINGVEKLVPNIYYKK